MKFKSPNTGDFVADHQYIAEIIVKRKADREKVVLPFKYWNLQRNKWATEYRRQVASSAKLVKKYSVTAIMNALKALPWCYSLTAPFLVVEIQNQQEALNKQEAAEKKKEVEVSDTTTVRKNYSKSNMLGKLR